MAGAAVEVGDVEEAVAGAGHEADDFGGGVFVVAADDGFDEEDVGFAEEIGSAGENFEVEAFGVDFYHVGQGRADGGDDFVECFYGDGDLLRAGGVAVAVGEDEGGAIVALRKIQGHGSGFIAGARVDPLNFVAAIEEILNVGLQVILRLDESVAGIGKMFEGGASPIAAVGADVENVFGGEAELLE